MKLIISLTAAYLALCGPWALAADPPKLSPEQSSEWKDAKEKVLLAELARHRSQEEHDKRMVTLREKEAEAVRELQATAARLLKAAGAENCELTFDGGVKCPPKAEPKK